jgi:hypothetical protein
MSENNNTTEVKENVIYGYINGKGEKVFTPNLDFANIMAHKYETYKLFEEKTII